MALYSDGDMDFAIGAAIAAERERCAKIADLVAQEHVTPSSKTPSAHIVAREIAAMIRSGKE